MILLIGYKGMLGTAALEILKKQEKPYMVSDQEIDIANIDRLIEFTENKSISWIINCAAYTAVDKARMNKSLHSKSTPRGLLMFRRSSGEKARNSSIYQLITFLTAQKTALMRKTMFPIPWGFTPKANTRGSEISWHV